MKTSLRGCVSKVAVFFPEEARGSCVNCRRKWLPVWVGLLFTAQALSALVEAVVQMKVRCQQGSFKYEPANCRKPYLPPCLLIIVCL